MIEKEIEKLLNRYNKKLEHAKKRLTIEEKHVSLLALSDLEIKHAYKTLYFWENKVDILEKVIEDLMEIITIEN
jgi:benzoyl-CoA reductase/2-hydroxyglutaryl-CoA dehydratase subunit BcrC/BadD/HgdB